MKPEEFKIEQLVVLKKEDGFCSDKKSFNKFLQSNSDIVISGNKLNYKSILEVQYNLICKEIGEKDQRFFQISLLMKNGEESLDIFVELNRVIKGVISKTGSIPETLRDDISTYYANRAYPHIHRIENLLRKLITNFMVRKIGSSYVSEASPEEFKTAINNSKSQKSNKQSYMDAMYQVDFKHLSDFLFKGYTRTNVDDLYELIKNAKSITDLNLTDLKEFTPKSNWQRYFSKEVECDDTFLSKRWNQLYDLRCMVAHNTLINKSIYQDILRLVNEVETVLQKAVEKLDNVDVPDEEQESVAENVASNINHGFAEFVKNWINLEQLQFDLLECAQNSIKGENNNQEKPSSQLITSALDKRKVISPPLRNELFEIRTFRNYLIHSIENNSASEINNMLKRIDECQRIITGSIKNINLRKITAEIQNNENQFNVETLTIYNFETSIKMPYIASFESKETLFEKISNDFFVPPTNIQVTFRQ